MLSIQEKQLLNRGLEEIAASLNLSETQIQAAKERYKAVGTHLQKDGSILNGYSPRIRVQGSFRLGTMIKPLNEYDEYDIDLLCQLDKLPIHFTQADLKKVVGDQLKDDPRYKEMLDKEGTKCWTLNYAESTRFHMDILPAVPDDNNFLYEGSVEKTLYQSAIKITDLKDAAFLSTNRKDWPKSNPIGYAEWFKSRMADRLLNQRQLLAESRKANIETIKDYMVKTPLQIAIQLLKRHRDIMFGDDSEKPISVIITTLAARLYNGEDSVIDTLTNVLNGMAAELRLQYDPVLRRSVVWVGNPTNPEENFADKWPFNANLEKNFRDWISKAKEDFAKLYLNGIQPSIDETRSFLGEQIVNEGLRKVPGIELRQSTALTLINKIGGLTLAYKEDPRTKWDLDLKCKVEISGEYKDGNGWHTFTPKTILPKNVSLKFIARTTAPSPFTVYWQVTNTGDEARLNLRGQIFKATKPGRSGLRQEESTSYKGTHSIECYIINKYGVCVAHSPEFLVNIN